MQSKQEIRNSANKFEFQNDSMDVVIAFLDEKTNTLTYSGSGRPLWILRGEEMIALKNSSLNL
ncbi:TPA: hypothetical protein DEP21_04275 [Patescibacteria group bacterium]|nr:hypothetical protein [Candidatus Gracilibacteria bacterium]